MGIAMVCSKYIAIVSIAIEVSIAMVSMAIVSMAIAMVRVAQKGQNMRHGGGVNRVRRRQPCCILSSAVLHTY